MDCFAPFAIGENDPVLMNITAVTGCVYKNRVLQNQDRGKSKVYAHAETSLSSTSWREIFILRIKLALGKKGRGFNFVGLKGLNDVI